MMCIGTSKWTNGNDRVNHEENEKGRMFGEKLRFLTSAKRMLDALKSR